MAKFQLSKVKKKHVFWAIVIFLFFAYLQQADQPEVMAAVDACGEDDYMCKAKEGMKPVWDWIFDHLAWVVAIVFGLVVMIYFFEVK